MTSRVRSSTILAALALVAALAVVAAAQAQPASAPGRGELLYATHCIACHDAQIHWRDGKQARDWNSLKAEVRRWQAIGQLGWDESDIDEVTGYLNRTVYRYPQPPGPVARE